MPRRVLRTAAAGLCATGGLVAAFAPAADASSTPAAAWWARTTLSMHSFEPVPEGNLAVELAPDGPSAVTAVAIDVTDAVSATLVLPVADGSSVSADSALQACTIPAPAWSASPDGAAGAWADRPEHDPDACADGTIDIDAGTVTFDLSPLIEGDRLDVLVVPGGDAFSTAGERLVTPPPTASAVDVERRQPPPPPVPAPDEVDEPEGERMPAAAPATVSASSTPARAPAPARPAARPSPPVTFAPVTPPAPTSATPAPTTTAAPASVAPSPVSVAPIEVASAPPLGAPSSDDLPGGRAFGLVLVAAGLAVAAWAHFSREPEIAEIGLGRFRTAAPGAAATVAPAVLVEDSPTARPADPAVGGLGRFAKARTKAPTPLS